MSTPFAAWIEDVFPGPGSLVSVTGPSIGSVSPGAAVTVRGALGGVIRTHVRAVPSVPRGAEDQPAAIVIDPPAVNALDQLRRGIIHDENVAIRSHWARIAGGRRAAEAARFELDGDVAYGLYREEGSVAFLVVVGAGLRPEDDLASRLRRVVLRDGRTVTVEELDAVQPGWPVRVFKRYPAAWGDVLIGSRCGPAEIGTMVVVPGYNVGEVLNQQVSGAVQVQTRPGADVGLIVGLAA